MFKTFYGQKALNLEEHIFGTTLAAKQIQLIHFWPSSPIYENGPLL